jgi:hypothetical protein
MSIEMIPVSWIYKQVTVHRKRANDSDIQYRKKVENLKANTIEDLIAKWKGIKEDKKLFQIGTQIIANTDPSMVRICTSIDVKVPPPIIGTFTGNTCTIAGEEHIEIKTKKTCHGVALYYNILGRKKHKYDRYLIELTRYSAFKDYIQKSQIEEYIDNLIKEMEK